MKRGIRDWGLGIGSVRQRRRPDRAGYSLVLFVMMFFGLMGLAALVIDMGFVRLAQRQMQTAVDSAALEGLRWRDSTTDPRQQASNMAAYTFDADLDLTTSDTQYGAGPVVTFSGGVGPPELVASQLMQPGTSPLYKPRRFDGTPGLELNQNPGNPNAIEGDMRAGQYGLNDGSGVESAYPTQATVDEGGDANYSTDNPYSRRDFFQQKPSPTPNAFLVRMRRTANPNGIDSEAGISSGGLVVNSDGSSSSPATLPVLFGRGSMMARSGTTGQLSVASGVTVRATAIAAAGTVTGLSQTPYEAGRAKAAGPPYQGTDANNNPVNIPGVTPFALAATSWGGAWTTQQLKIASDGTTLVAADVTGTTWGKVLQVATNIIAIGQQVGGPSVPVGNASTLAITTSSSLYSPINLYQYAPVYDASGAVAPGSIIVGFGYVQWTWNPSSEILTVTNGAFGTTARRLWQRVWRQLGRIAARHKRLHRLVFVARHIW